MDLPPAIQAAVRKGTLSVSLAKILIGKEIDQQLFLFKEIIENFEEPPMEDAIREKLAAFVAKRKEEGGAPTDF